MTMHSRLSALRTHDSRLITRLSSLQAAEGDAFDEPALAEDPEGEDGGEGEVDGRQYDGAVGDEAAAELGDGEGDGLHLRGANHDQGPEVHVPGGEEGDDAVGGQGRAGEGEGQFPVHVPGVGAVEAGGLVE